jgi:acylphosphatase
VTIRRRVVVSGRVQGVFFRDSCRDKAEQSGVSGWVRNRSDGKLEAAFEGDEAAVSELVEWCRAGPGAADVDDVTVTEEQPENAAGFSIR